jgi:hypothetical protein
LIGWVGNYCPPSQVAGVERGGHFICFSFFFLLGGVPKFLGIVFLKLVGECALVCCLNFRLIPCYFWIDASVASSRK